MKSGPTSHSTTLGRAAGPFFVLAVACLLTLSVSAYVMYTVRARDRAGFQDAVQEAQHSIQRRLQTYIAFLHGAAGLFAASDDVTRDEFQTYVRRLQLREHFLGIQGIGYVRRLARNQKDQLVSEIRQSGVDDYRIWPDSDLPEAFPVVYLEPADRRNRAAMGYDHFPEPVRRAAIAQARDSGDDVASGRVTLVHERAASGEAGFLIFVPLYPTGLEPQTVEQRRQSLQGFIYGAFRVGDLIEGSLTSGRSGDLRLEIHESEAAAADPPLYRSAQWQEQLMGARLQHSQSLELPGRSWQIRYAAGPGFGTALWKNPAPYVFLGGLLISGGLFAVTLSLAAARGHAERIAAELRESERRFRSIVETASEGIWTIDAMDRVNYVNPRMAEMLGYAPDAMLGRPLSDFRFPEDQEELARALQRRRQGVSEQYDVRYRRKDGAPLWTRISTIPFMGEGGTFLGALAMVTDISERKYAEEALRLSEERYRSLVLATSQVVWITTPEGEIATDLPTWRAFTGQTEEQVRGRGWIDAVHPDDRERMMQVWARSLQSQVGHEQEFRVRAADGSWRLVLARAVPVLERDGRVREWIGTCTDITDHRRAEDGLRFLAEASATFGSSLEYETTLTNVARLAVPRIADWCAVDIVAEDGALQRLAVAHVDARKVELARSIQERYPVDMNSPRGIPNVLRTGRSEIYPHIPDDLLVAAARDDEHLRILRELGMRSAMIVPLVARGRAIGAISFISAESAHRYGGDDLERAEELARRAAIAVDNARLYREAQQANHMKDEFLATVSHELRTPLNAMLGWAQLLGSGRLDADTAAEAVNAIERNAKAQAQLVEDLLDLSRIIRGKLQMDMRPVVLESVIESAITAVQPAASARRIDVRRRIDPSARVVMGDATRLQQVVWNLLSNAVKFTPEGGWVEVVLDRSESTARIIVRDTGKGISPQFLPHVFDRFRQADGSITRQYGGLGLGLAIVRHLVELHGGTVSAESPGEGQGATLTVELPLAPSGAEPQAEATGRLAQWEQSDALVGLRVLVVDDEPDARLLVRTVLERSGAHVESASSAYEAFSALEKFQPDVLLSDIGMPGEDGFELMKRIRAREAQIGGRLPAAALTAFARTEDRMRVLAAGYQLHVPKPVEPAELLAVVKSLAGRGDDPGRSQRRLKSL